MIGCKMTDINLNCPEVFNAVGSHLIDRIRSYCQRYGNKKVVAWLFVHGMEEGNAFELAIFPKIENPKKFMQEVAEYKYNFGQFIDKNEPDDIEFCGSNEIKGIYEWNRQWYDALDKNDEKAIEQLPNLIYKDWQLMPLINYKIDSIGFEAEEAENVFAQRIYTDILMTTAQTYQNEIQGFILEMHDSALPIQWISIN